VLLSEIPKLLRGLRCGGNGLPSPGASSKVPESCPRRSGVNCGAFDGYELKGGDLERGDRFDFTAELGIPASLEARGIRLAGEPGSEEPR
jgi:hypothetical protein